MHVLLITHFLPPERNAGTENYTFGLAKALQARGHKVEALCAGSWQEGDAYWNGVTRETYGGIPLHRINLNWTEAADPNRVTYDSEPIEKWLAQLLDKNPPTVVHVTSTMTLGVGVLRVTRKAEVPLVLTLMDFWFLCPRTVLVRGDGQLCDGRTTPSDCQRCLLTSSNAYQRVNSLVPGRFQPLFWNRVSKHPSLARVRGMRGMALDMEHRRSVLEQALELPDVVLSHSATVQQMFAQAGLSRKIVHLPNGHEMNWLSRYCGKETSPVLRFGYIGQIQESKGVHTLVDAFRRLQLEKEARLDIWGDLTRNRDYVQRLEHMIGDGDSVRLRGWFERSQLADVFAEIDVLVVPSLWYENSPLVIQEAFATSTPVIASDLGGMAEAIRDGVDGLLFKRGDAGDLSDKLRRMVTDRALFEQLRANVPAVKSIDQEVTELEAIYHQVGSMKRDQSLQTVDGR